MKLLIGSIGWWLSVSALFSLGGWSGGIRSWWRSWLGATLISGGLLGVGAALTAPPWLTLCVAHTGGTSTLVVGLLRYQQRGRGATGWKDATRRTWQLLRANSGQLWASLPQRRRHAWAWWQYTGQYLLDWQQWLLWSMLLITGIAAVAPVPGRVPSASVAAQLVDVTRALGEPLIMCLVIVETILVVAGFVRITDVLLRTMKRVAIFTWLLGIVVYVGPSFEDMARRSPTDAALLAGALVLVVWVVHQVPVQVQPATSLRVATAPRVDDIRYVIPYQQSSIDRETAAVHEAGHALLYAALLPWHPDIAAVVYAVPQHGRGGYVTAPLWDQMNATATLVEWHMLLFLAGQAAEHALRGTSCMGSSDDYQRWHALAIDYVANGHGPAASPCPVRVAEQMQHEQALRILRSEQRALLAAFLAHNQQPLQDLADALCRRQVLHTGDLRCFWECVEIPEGFPRPTWTETNMMM